VEVMVQPTGKPGTPLPNASSTTTRSGLASAAPTIPVCASPSCACIRDAAAGRMSTAVLTVSVSPGAVKRSVYAPTVSRTSWSKVAIPATAITASAPPSVAPSTPVAISTETVPTNPVAMLPCASRAATTIGASVSPASAVAAGSVSIVSAVAAPAVAVAVNVTGEPPSPSAAAVTSRFEGTRSSSTEVAAMPSASVATTASDSVPSPVTRVHVTSTPLTPLPKSSVTRTRNGAGSVVPTTAVCASPSSRAIVLAAAGTTVNASVTNVPIDPKSMTSEYVPAESIRTRRRWRCHQSR
jgi:hypothetical protein